MSYLGFISTEKSESSKGLWEPTVVCKCGNRHEGDEPSINVKECEQCEETMIEHEEGIMEMIDRDDKVWMSTCCGGSANRISRRRRHRRCYM
jgi:hypothetical protein